MFEVGQTILGVYTVEKFLGAGGAGEVFLVRRTLDNARYAVKTIHSKKVGSTQLRQDLLREIRISRDLGSHPNIVPCRFFRIVNDRLTVFSDYVDGGTLHSWIRSGKIKERKQLLDIAIQIAWGLDVAHAAGIIHKDIKPANILMERDGRARIADFGLIRGMTPVFCSPEQMSEQTLTPATDIWSYALLIMLMWFGKGYWMLGPQAPDALDHLHRDEGSFGAAPAALIDLLTDCLQNDPARRPETAMRIAEALKTVYREEAGHDYPRPDPPELTASSSHRTGDSIRASVIDGNTLKDPRDLLNEISHRLDASSIDVESLIPEVRKPPETFIDDLHVYLFIEDILRKVSAQGDPEWMELLAETLKRKAWLLADTGDLEAAIAHHEHGVEILKEIILWHDRPDLWKALSGHWSDAAFCHLHREKPDTAKESIRQAVRALEKIPDHLRNTEYYFDAQTIITNRGIICALTGDPEAATVHFEEALSILDRVDPYEHPLLFLRNKAQAEYNLGTHLNKIDQNEKASVHFRNALKLQSRLMEQSDDLNDRRFLANISQNLAVTMVALKRMDTADFFFRKAGEIMETLLKNSDHHYVQRKYAHFLKNYGYFKFETGAVDDAVDLAQKALSILKTVIRQDGVMQYALLMAGLYSDLAEYYDTKNQPEKAREHLTHAEKYKNLS